ncbi:minichromosome maintenance complex component 3 associated protein [Chamberlinius hualienensis]
MNKTFKSSVVGICTEMCSKDEVLRRERQHQIHKYELSDKHNYRKADSAKCVKEFTRAAAGQSTPKASDIRPPSVLLETVNYLLTRILMMPNEKWLDKYDFIFDRLRSVRQDMIFQDVFNETCATAMENIVRFHIYSIYRSIDFPLEEYDPYINETHLRELVYHWLTLPQSVRSNSLCHEAEVAIRSWILGNYVKLFRVMKTLPVMCCFALLPHIPLIRRKCICMMSTGYSVKNGKYPLKKLTELLLFNDEKEAASTCKYYGLTTDENSVYFFKSNFLQDKAILKPYRYKFIEEKLELTSLPDLLFEDNYVKQTNKN